MKHKQDVPQFALDAIAQTVASEVHRVTGHMVGHSAKFDAIGNRVIFTFKVGLNEATHESVFMESIKRPHAFDVISTLLIGSTLGKNGAQSISERAATRKHRTFKPEIAHTVDQKGNRHFRLQADAGVFNVTGKEI